MLLLCFLLNFSNPLDSIGFKQVDKRSFILYQVSEGESFFSIARRYGLKPYQIRAANPEIESLRLGDIILIPTDKPAPKKPSFQTGQIHTHRVEAGETLFSLSQLYGVPVAQLMRNNDLQTSFLAEGKVLKIGKVKMGPFQVYTLDSAAISHIVSKNETFNLISEKYKIPIDLIFKNNNLSENLMLREGMELIISARPVTVLQVDSDFSYYSPDPLGMPANFDERGTGTLISNDIPKNVALHKTQTVGKYIKIFFPGTKRAVMAKVIGEVPEFERNKGIVVKISRNAGKSLGVKNAEFPVILQYEKP